MTQSVILRSTLAEERKQDIETRNMLKSLTLDADILEKSRKLIDGMNDLKDKKLLVNRTFHIAKYPAIGKSAYVYNDYHTAQTNPGYSRNKMGGKFFTR